MSKANGKCVWLACYRIGSYTAYCRYCERDRTYTGDIHIKIPERTDEETLQDYCKRVEATTMPYEEKLRIANEINDRPCEVIAALKAVANA